MNSKNIVELYHSIRKDAEGSLFEQLSDNLIDKFLQKVSDFKIKKEWGYIYNAKVLSFFVKEIRLDTCEITLLEDCNGVNWNGWIGKFDMECFVSFDEFIANPDKLLKTFGEYRGNYETFLEDLFHPDPNLTYEDMKRAFLTLVDTMKRKGFQTFICVTDFDQKLNRVRATLTFSVEV